MKKKKRKNVLHRYLILILILLIIVWISIFLLFGIYRLLTKNSVLYNPDQFIVNKDGRMTFDNNLYSTKTGIDVSSFQREIDWKQVKESGIDFAIIRCGYRGATEGKLHEDNMFKENIEGALKNNIDVGVYFYSTATTEKELQEEIDFVLELIQDYSLEFPVCYDMEYFNENDRLTSLSKEKKTQFALDFCKAMEKEGYRTLIYGNKHWLENEFDLDKIKKYDLWYAAYIEKPELNAHFKMWQYSNSGQIDGISTNVDLNLYIE